MIVYYAAAAIVVLALLLSIPRRPLGDILHFLAVVLSLGAAYYLVTNYSEYAYSFAAERYGITIEGKPFLLAILKASARPAMFTAAFIVCFIVIGLIFHFISIIGKKKKDKEKKLRIIPLKLILGIISGVLIAAALAVPCAFYPSRADSVLKALDLNGISVDARIPDLSQYELDLDAYDLLTDRLIDVEYNGKIYDHDECVSAYTNFKKVLNTINSNDSAAIEKCIRDLTADPATDEILGNILSENEDLITDAFTRAIFAEQGSISSKLSVITLEPKLLNMMAGNEDCKETLLTFMREASPDTCRILGKLCCTFDNFKISNYRGAYYAPLIGKIMDGIAAMEDRSPENTEKEAEMLAYMFNIDKTDMQSCFNFNDLDPDLAAEYINDSFILKHAFIEVTDHGNTTDPCRTASRIYSNYSSTIIYRLDTLYGFHEDSELYKCLMAFFNIKEI